MTTASAERFMLRNAATLLPPAAAPSTGTTPSLGSEEALGEPLAVKAMAGAHQAGQWSIDGKPYLLRSVPLANTQYQLLTLAPLDHLAALRRQHLWIAALVASVGLLFIVLCSHVVNQMLARRQDEQYAANYDALTDLPNRRHMLAELQRLFAIATRTQQRVVVAFSA